MHYSTALEIHGPKTSRGRQTTVPFLITVSFGIVYVLTSNGSDPFADMAFISMLSVRHSNPGMRITVLCDGQSARDLRRLQHRVLGACDELAAIETPPGNPQFRNRWIKTQVPRFAHGDGLYLDVDTMVRGSLSPLPRLVSDFGGVANHNAATPIGQLWDGDRIHLETMGWPHGDAPYLNGGVWFWRATPATMQFFERWHHLWLQGARFTSRTRDQPSLNQALRTTPAGVTVLPADWNTQVHFNWSAASDAVIWHFYTTESWKKTSFGRLVFAARLRRTDQMVKEVAKAVSASAPWPNFDFLSRAIAATLPPDLARQSPRALKNSGRSWDAIRLAWLHRPRSLPQQASRALRFFLPAACED